MRSSASATGRRPAPRPSPEAGIFEYANEWYPDTDDTAEVLTALSRVRFPGEAEDLARQGAVARGQAWILAMQNSDGGWGAFDKDCDNEVLTFIPFADHNAMIDPSCEDITGRTLEALHGLGVPAGNSAVRRAASYLERKQHGDGTWYGRWGCNYIYGSWLALRGLLHAGGSSRAALPAHRRVVPRASERRRRLGQSFPRTYDDPTLKGQGPDTVPDRLGADGACSRRATATRRPCGAASTTCCRIQDYDGSWKDEHWTGTGFPKVFYLRYHLYATYFPLWALSLYAREEAGGRDRPAHAGSGEVDARAYRPRSELMRFPSTS